MLIVQIGVLALWTLLGLRLLLRIHAEAVRNSARRLPPLWAYRAALRIVLTDPERTGERRLLALLTLGLVVALLAPRTGVR